MKIVRPIPFVGGKTKLLPKLRHLFPQDYNTFFDLCCGGCGVAANIEGHMVVAVDKLLPMIEMYRWIQKTPNVVEQVLETCDKFGITYSKRKWFASGKSCFKATDQSKAGYAKLKEVYNQRHDPLLLLVLMFYSFNHHLRFDQKGRFCESIGSNVRSGTLSELSKRNLQIFHERLQDIQLVCGSFVSIQPSSDDFVFTDPPYSLADAPYCSDSKWTTEDDQQLMAYLDALPCRWMMTNTLVHKGQEHGCMIKWAEKHNVIPICDRTTGYWQRDKNIKEVAITNYPCSLPGIIPIEFD